MKNKNKTYEIYCPDCNAYSINNKPVHESDHCPNDRLNWFINKETERIEPNFDELYSHLNQEES